MADETESGFPKVQINKFAGKSSLVVRGENTAEVLNHATELADNAAAIAEQLTKFEQLVFATEALTTPAQASGTTESKPAAAKKAAPNCDHGIPRVFKEGTNKAGKPWKAYFCANDDRDDQCDAVWVK